MNFVVKSKLGDRTLAFHPKFSGIGAINNARRSARSTLGLQA
jgi:hypothetical protein